MLPGPLAVAARRGLKVLRPVSPAVPTDEDDPGAVHTVAVTVEDVVTACEANRQTHADTVLRVTPPFSGRMRARVHRLDVDPDAADAVHVRPGDLLAEGAPDYPHPDDTEDDLRADPDVSYSRERHRERHRERVRGWREQVRDHVVDSAPLRTPDGSHEVDVVALG